MIFVDTSFWYALFDPKCREHKLAKATLARQDDRLVTSEFVLSESLTLLRSRGLHEQGLAMWHKLFAGELARLVQTTEIDFQRAWQLFQFRDKQWSFVDCLSFALIERFGIRKALAFDHHFRQFGSIEVLP